MDLLVIVCAVLNLIAGAMWLTGWWLKRKFPNLAEWINSND